MVTLTSGKTFDEIRKANKLTKRAVASRMVLTGFSVTYVMAVLTIDADERAYLDKVAQSSARNRAA